MHFELTCMDNNLTLHLFNATNTWIFPFGRTLCIWPNPHPARIIFRAVMSICKINTICTISTYHLMCNLSNIVKWYPRRSVEMVQNKSTLSVAAVQAKRPDLSFITKKHNIKILPSQKHKHQRCEHTILTTLNRCSIKKNGTKTSRKQKNLKSILH